MTARGQSHVSVNSKWFDGPNVITEPRLLEINTQLHRFDFDQIFREVEIHTMDVVRKLSGMMILDEPCYAQMKAKIT